MSATAAGLPFCYHDGNVSFSYEQKIYLCQISFYQTSISRAKGTCMIYDSLQSERTWTLLVLLGSCPDFNHDHNYNTITGIMICLARLRTEKLLVEA